MRNQALLSAADFMAVWSVARPGPVPPVFGTCLGQHVVEHDEWATRIDHTMGRLGEHGLAGQHGLASWLAGALALLGGPRWAVEARLIGGDRKATSTTGGSMRAYAAADDDDGAVVTTLADGMITLASSTPHRAVTDVVTLAGEVDAGPGRSVNVPVDVFRAAVQGCGGDPDDLTLLLTDAGVPRGEASMLSRINAEYRRGGEFGVLRPDRDGALAPGDRVVTFIDTANGRWAQRVSTGHDGQRWITTTPASTTELAVMVAELLSG